MARIKLQNLALLHRSMRVEDITQQKFNYKIGNRAEFEVLFSVQSEPYTLALTEKKTLLFIKVAVYPGYFIASNFDSDLYYALARLFKINGESFMPFKPESFWREFDSIIPTVAREGRVPTKRDIARIRQDLPESDKPYFLTWRRNDLQGASVSERNLEKTLEMLGKEAVEFSKTQNVSSCWTADPNRSCHWNKKYKAL